MIKTILIAAGAGLVSTLLAATIVSGSALALLLVLLVPLPLMIVALGWHPLVGLLGGILSCLVLSVVFHDGVAVMFAVTTVVPAWLLPQLFLFPRTAGNGSRPPRWLDPGVVLLAASLYAVVVILIGALSIDTDYAEFRRAATTMAEQWLRLFLNLPSGAPLRTPDGRDASALVPQLATAMSILPVTGFITSYALSGWLAALVVHKSGLLPRPRPVLPDISFPRGTAILFGLAFLATLLPGYPGYAARLTVSSLMFAFTLLGFAVLHALTRGLGGRGLILTITWLTTLIIGFPGVLVAGLGFAEQLLGLRARQARRRGPPSSTNPT
jgi:hypothetical protein